MGRRRRRSMASLMKDDIPSDPGVYALYRSGKRMYVGKAKCLQDRVWKNHSGLGLGMSSSAMRRNITEHLGIATANEIKQGLYRVSPQDAKRVRAWLDGCEIAWRMCATEAGAKALETALKKEYLPPLTKR
jgi:excinuclease UvrABC nuclease subunit